MTKQNKPDQAEWEKIFDYRFTFNELGTQKLYTNIDQTRGIKNFIRNLLSEQEAEKKEAYAVGYSEGALATKINYIKEIDKLKQQHREELISIVNAIRKIDSIEGLDKRLVSAIAQVTRLLNSNEGE